MKEALEVFFFWDKFTLPPDQLTQKIGWKDVKVPADIAMVVPATIPIVIPLPLGGGRGAGYIVAGIPFGCTTVV